MPFQEILGKLAEQGFLEKFKTGTGRIKPTSIPKFLFLDHPSILQRYNAILRGFINYYSVANNSAKLHHIVFILKHSCAKTLARKFNLRTRSKTFRKFGTDLTYTNNNNSIGFTKPRPFKWTGFPNNERGKNYKDFLTPTAWEIRSKSNLFKECIEMHHIRKINKD
jgi:hypothetical protein